MTRRGFTLIELLATVVVLGAIGGVAARLIAVATDQYAQAATAAQLHAELSIALDRCVRELRSIDIDEDADGLAPDIDAIAADSITWEGGEELRLDDDRLILLADDIEGVLLTDVTAFTIDARDGADDAIGLPAAGAACDEVRRIRVAITIERSGVSESLGTTIALRCAITGAGG